MNKPLSSHILMSEIENKNIILFSVPRSGSTWLSEVLTHDNNIRKVHEPDNELNSYLGLHFKTGLPRFPFFTENDHNKNYKELFQLALNHHIAEQGDWRNKFIFKLNGLKKEKIQKHLFQKGTALTSPLFLSGFWKNMVVGARTDQKTLLKTVHACLAIPFLIKNLDFQPILLTRHPLNCYSSYVNLSMPDGNRQFYKHPEILSHFRVPKISDPSEKSISFLSGYQSGIFEKAIESYRTLEAIHFINYEDIISNPFEQVKNLCLDLGIDYSDEMQQFMASKFKAGKGYDTNRNLKDHEMIWKKRLSTEQVEDFLKGYEFAFGSINFDV